jgi:hypothetical protein
MEEKVNRWLTNLYYGQINRSMAMIKERERIPSGTKISSSVRIHERWRQLECTE